MSLALTECGKQVVLQLKGKTKMSPDAAELLLQSVVGATDDAGDPKRQLECVCRGFHAGHVEDQFKIWGDASICEANITVFACHGLGDRGVKQIEQSEPALFRHPRSGKRLMRNREHEVTYQDSAASCPMQSACIRDARFDSGLLCGTCFSYEMADKIWFATAQEILIDNVVMQEKSKVKDLYSSSYLEGDGTYSCGESALCR